MDIYGNVVAEPLIVDIRPTNGLEGAVFFDGGEVGVTGLPLAGIVEVVEGGVGLTSACVTAGDTEACAAPETG